MPFHAVLNPLKNTGQFLSIPEKIL